MEGLSVSLGEYDVFAFKFSRKRKIFGVELIEGLLDVRSQVSIGQIDCFGDCKFTQFGISDPSVFVSKSLTGSVDAPHYIEETCRVFSCSVKLLPILCIPLVAVTFSVARSSLPKLHLVGPVDISDDFMLGEMQSCWNLGDVVEGIFSKEIIPQDKYWCSSVAHEIMVPFFQGSDELIAFLSDNLIGEEQKLGLAIYMDEKILSFFD